MDRAKRDAPASQGTARLRAGSPLAAELQVTMNLTLRIWRQLNTKASGGFATYRVKDVQPDMSFLEMLDKLNEELLGRGEPPVAFEHDCREGICGSCSKATGGSPRPRSSSLSLSSISRKDMSG